MAVTAEQLEEMTVLELVNLKKELEKKIEAGPAQ